MKKPLIIILAFLMLFSCNKKEKDENNISFITISVINAKSENHPLNLLVDLNWKRILIYDNKINFAKLPPNPEENANTTSEHLFSIDEEVIALSYKEAEQIKSILSDFKEEDFKSKSKTSYDGVALKLNFLYDDNSFQNIELINNSTTQQTIFFKQLFTILFDKSNQENILNEYYNKAYLE